MSKPAHLISSGEIDDKCQEIESLRSQFLRQQGWKESSQHPGAIWLWEKTLDDGRHYCCGESTAMHIEEQITCSECCEKHSDCQCEPIEQW